jgi:hypothetical protein
LIKAELVSNERLFVELFIVLNLLFDFIEKVGVYDSFIASSVCLFFETIDFSDFFIELMKDLLHIVFHLFAAFFEGIAFVLFLVALDSLDFAHTTSQELIE